MAGRITISDIAKSAKVSKTTISRYLNGNYNYMSAETRSRIEQIIKEYDYVPNNVARTLKSKKSGMIGVIVNTLRYQVGAQTVTGINDICSKNGYGTIVYCSNDDQKTEQMAIQLCLNQQVEGLIIIPCENSVTRYNEICERGIPVVLCTRQLAEWSYGCVYVKHDELIRNMLYHLKEQGFEKSRFLLDVRNFHKKWMGDVFAQTAQELFGMTDEESVVLVGRDNPAVGDALDVFLHQYPGQRKAIMAVNTHTLFLVLQELEQRKIRIPHELGVCGYDAVGWSELVYPGISAIRQPMDRMGIMAAEKMMESLREHQPSQGGTALQGSLFFRNSTNLKML
ncbi:LacI family DNA-binding transcriptional regulator [Oscillospiraceae bacterium LTW-04]|nr:LacI family DNA-binding transcriptional regulator [Oscillospiraceae bacterium MB24-C1]